jgi:hypothetical protein
MLRNKGKVQQDERFEPPHEDESAIRRLHAATEKQPMKLTQCPENNDHIYPILLHETFLRNRRYWLAFRRERRWDPQLRSTDRDMSVRQV